MALILPTSVCAICGEKLDRPYTATSGVAFPKEHRLYKYCDAPLHYDCLETWLDRIEFARGYFEGKVHGFRSGLTGHLLAEGIGWALVCGPYNGTDLRLTVEAGWFSEEETVQLRLMLGDKPQYVVVELSEWIVGLRTNWDNWTDFVHGKYKDGLEGVTLHSVEQIMGEVEQIAPNSLSLTKLLTRS